MWDFALQQHIVYSLMWQDLSRTYLAHHELESGVSIIIIIIDVACYRGFG